MIGHIQHPDKPDEVLNVALYMERRPVWSSLPGFYSDDLEAARACANKLASYFAEITYQARILRVICEHPAFEFESEGVDADTIRAQAVMVDELIQAQVFNVRHLLDGPAIEDVIRVAGVRMRTRGGGLLEDRPADADDVLSPEDEQRLNNLFEAFCKVFRGMSGNAAMIAVYDRVMGILEEVGASYQDQPDPDVSKDGAEVTTGEYPPVIVPTAAADNENQDKDDPSE